MVTLSRGSTPKAKTPLVQSKTIVSSKLDSTLPIFPELGVTVSGNAKYEVFMSGADSGRVREIKVNTCTVLPVFLDPVLCSLYRH